MKDLDNLKWEEKPQKMLKIPLLILFGLGGLWLSFRYFRKNIQEIKQKPEHKLEDKLFNYPLMVLWFGYLMVFFSGLIVNNLILK